MPSVRMDKNHPPRSRLRSPVVLASAAALIVVVLIVAAVMSKPRPVQAPTEHPPTSSVAAAAGPPACQRLDATVNALTPRQKLAQLLMVGVKNLADAQAVVREHEVGGIFITSWTDYSMLGAPLAALAQEPRPLPLAVSVDEEGGRVQRLKGLIGSQPSPRELVAAGKTPEQVRDIARQRGLAMRELGITIDFAPVVDITDAADGTVIGDRSWGNTAEAVTAYAGAYADGLRDAGLLPVLKHFPGHGHASGDSHKGGVVTPPLAQLETLDLVPYQSLTTSTPVAVMVGHMQVPGLTGTDPASLSKAAYDLLRGGRYGGQPYPSFNGAAFTDDLSSMGAITQRYSVPEAVLKALQAGADTALWITTKEVPDVLDRLQQAVDAHELSQERVDDAVRHMAVTKNPVLACTA
ncbi:glycoside hydrolase family 3 N-terminal domain-containing protein [Mycolicibacterium sp. HS_4_1]